MAGRRERLVRDATLDIGNTYVPSITSPVRNREHIPRERATTLAVSPIASVFGQEVTLTATVNSTAGTPSGVVEFFDGATSLGTAAVTSGVATLATTTLAVGAHSVGASYTGDGAFLPSTASPASVAVSRASTTMAISSSPNPAGRRDTVTLTASVGVIAPGGGTPTGQVEFRERRKLLGRAELINGVATLTVTFTKMGQIDLGVSYAGDSSL
jgi:hypothetical protein